MENLPQDFIDRLKRIVPEVQYENVLATYNIRRPTTFRTNTLKTTTETLYKKLTNQGLKLENVVWLPDAFILKDQPQYMLTDTLEYANGELYVQSLSSMIPPLVLNPQIGETILDLCAAPGSKTTQMSAMMHNTGIIFANDLSRIRLYKLDANLKLQGVENTKTIHTRGEFIWKKYNEEFDRALADVPCSLEGRFTTTDPKSYAEWSVKKVKELSKRMRHLLRSAISATKPGGYIVYSTCTLSPEENEEIIDWIIKVENKNISIEEVNIPGLQMYPGLTQWEKKFYNQQVTKTKRIFPTSTMEAFYIALIKKN